MSNNRMKKSSRPTPETSLSTLHTLHQEKLARISSASLPRISSLHSGLFLKMVEREQDPGRKNPLGGGGGGSGGGGLNSVRFRSTLWGEEIQGLSTTTIKEVEGGKDPYARPATEQGQEFPTTTLPEWYDLHNPRCRSCLLPLIPGINSLHQAVTLSRGFDESASSSTNPVKVTTTTCSLCRDSKPLKFREVRRRKASEEKEPKVGSRLGKRKWSRSRRNASKTTSESCDKASGGRRE
ncbi:hypothetical protein IE53DRAFT_384836 [Violaceomyces palustris]|uniref:Uncharacterized protein n=1 Tax=Violaceomyces palustris TaxID=1673888 RepID=A0ACD0P3V2_9BASI|nr:hypothetical protein IE53DRAFT_384836 [Violaceomyces palustris]